MIRDKRGLSAFGIIVGLVLILIGIYFLWVGVAGIQLLGSIAFIPLWIISILGGVFFELMGVVVIWKV